jgi:hypothetical protein
MDSTVALDSLLSPEGQALLHELAREPLTADAELGVITRYRARYAVELLAAALAQIKLRRRARAKFTRADEMYFTGPGLEQASSERMSRHHAGRYTSFKQVADLCSGIGGDLIGLASRGDVLAVDVDPVRLRMGKLNARAYGLDENVTSVESDVRDIPLAGIDAVFIDPARRSEDRRFRGAESEPPLAWCFALADHGLSVGIKAAPRVAVETVPLAWELEFVSEGRELKESVLWSPSLATTRRRATILPHEHTLIDSFGAALDVRPPGQFLLDPDPAVTRAALVEALGRSLGDAWKIDDQVAFLSSDRPFDTPFGRGLKIEASIPWSLKSLKETLRRLDVGTVDIRKRGSAVDVEDLQRRLKLSGNRSATVVLTRMADRPWAMVCTPEA